MGSPRRARKDSASVRLDSRETGSARGEPRRHELPGGAVEYMARCYRALGHPSRLRALDVLQRSGETGVEELSVHLEIARPMLSKHLQILCEVGLVERRRSGRVSLYRAPSSSVKPMLDAVSDHVARHGAAVAQTMESEAMATRL
jgi:DNA-binding transcriptional ArsR family regulator